MNFIFCCKNCICYNKKSFVKIKLHSSSKTIVNAIKLPLKIKKMLESPILG
jgi:hypothetical protein